VLVVAPALNTRLRSTHPEHRSNWLARRLVARAARFRLPVFHIVADSTLGVEFLVAA
jgi:hypothetical protein